VSALSSVTLGIRLCALAARRFRSGLPGAFVQDAGRHPGLAGHPPPLTPDPGWPCGGHEAREPEAGSLKTRLRAMSDIGAGSPLRMANRRESLPDR
jgi:hypothetical protein